MKFYLPNNREGLRAVGQAVSNVANTRDHSIQLAEPFASELVVEVLRLHVDLEEFLTPERRDAVCSMGSRLSWIAGGHQMEQRIRGEPYPKKRVLSAALSGDPQAIHAVWEHRDRVVALAEGVLSDAETTARKLRLISPKTSSEWSLQPVIVTERSSRP